MSSLIYLLTIRLTTLAIGAMTLFLGYRLVMQQNPIQHSSQQTNESGSVSASVGETKIEVKNVASGIFFAVFGMFLVVVTIFANPPEIAEKTSVEKITDGNKTTEIKTEEINSRGGETDKIIKETAEKLHQQAENLNDENNLKAAYEIEKSAAALQPENDLYLETVAHYASKNKDCENAIKYMQQAVALQASNSHFQEKLQQYQKDCS